MKDIAKSAVYIGIFAVPFIPLIVANTMFFPFITGKNFTFRIIVEVIFAAWIILALYEPMYRPRFSWVVAGFASLLGVMFFANILGEYPLKSFWSNYERMEGYVTLVHVFGFLLVVGSVITTEKMWNRLLATSVASACILSLYAFGQLSGNLTINQGGWRLDGTLGNSAYMAIYMLFHIFIAALLLVRTQSKHMRYLFTGLIALFVYLLIQTATRGTILGLVGGGFLSVAYIALFSKQYPSIRKISAGVLVAIVMIVGLFIGAKESSFVQGNPYLARIASISLHEASTRFEIWSMAFEGVKERPILGWGQGNYNYVFNKYYEPSLYGQEAWFDRVHNIAMDWLIAGGVLGLLAYVSILLAALYYILWRPFFNKDESFSVMERGVLLGLLAGYVFHNIFVFDNIVSYVFYGLILAFIHSRVSRSMATIENYRIDQKVIGQVVAPVVIVLLVGCVYWANVPHIKASQDIIKAFTSETGEEMLTNFDTALSRGSFGDQEIREQMMRQIHSVGSAQNVTQDFKNRFFQRTEQELLKQIEEKPGDARVHVFVSSFYRSTGRLPEAVTQLDISRALSPQKQQIIFEQALAQTQLGNHESAQAFLKEAFDLAPNFRQARVLYAMSALQAGDTELVQELIYGEDVPTDTILREFAKTDIAVQAAYANKAYDLLKDVFTVRLEQNPDDPQNHVSLAVIYYESGDSEAAIEVLRASAEQIPSFKAQSEQFILDIEEGRTPGAPRVNVSGEEVEVTAH